MNMILGKRHIILAALVLSLGIAVYLNWAYSTSGSDFIATEATTETKNYGDSKYVGTDGEEIQVVSDSTYFKEARLTRTKTRDEAMDSLKKMFKGADLSDADKTSLAVQATQLAQAIEMEGSVENLIRACGFMDCMVYLSGDKVDVVVKSAGLTKEDAARIKDILIEQTSVAVENISITEAQ